MKQNDVFFRYVRDFLTTYLPKQRNCSPYTIKSYRETINLYRTFLADERNIPFVKITFEQFDFTTVCAFLSWLQIKRNCSTATRNQRLAGINSFLNYAAIQDPALVENYLKVKKVPVKKNVRQPVKGLSEAALRNILEQPDITNKKGFRDRFFMILLYDTGARIQEILDVKVRDICLDVGMQYIRLCGKGNKVRSVPLADRTAAHLCDYLDQFHPLADRRPESFLFFTDIKGNRGRMSPENVACFLRKYGKSAREKCKEVPEKLHAHQFRHARATHLYRSGIPLSYIKDFLGHADINTTTIYATTDLEMMKAALENVRIDKGNTTDKYIWDGNEEMILKLCGLM